MWNTPPAEALERIPKLYATASIPAAEKIIHLHFFFGGCDWYVAEYDGDELFFGYAVLNDDLPNAEWVFISFSELKDISIYGLEVDRDVYWKPTPAGEIERIKDWL